MSNSPEALSTANNQLRERLIEDANRMPLDRLLAEVEQFESQTGRKVPKEFIEWLRSRVYIGADSGTRPEFLQ
jgi:hypothetical protein